MKNKSKTIIVLIAILPIISVFAYPEISEYFQSQNNKSKNKVVQEEKTETSQEGEIFSLQKSVDELELKINQSENDIKNKKGFDYNEDGFIDTDETELTQPGATNFITEKRQEIQQYKLELVEKNKQLEILQLVNIQADYESKNGVKQSINFQKQVKPEPIVTAFFSVLPDRETPKEFEKTDQTEASLVFDFTNENVFGFIAEVENDGEILQSGIKVWAKEYDNRLGFDGFATEIESILEDDFVVTNTKITLASDVKLGEIKNIYNQSSTYYFAVTADNYYFIQIIEETKYNPEFYEINDFTANLINWLYLN